MGKVLGGILSTLVVVMLALFLLSYFGLLSWGNGNGVEKTKTEIDESEDAIIEDKVEEITITIIVTQDRYVIDEQEVTLTQIKEKVTDEAAVIKVVLEDNYASTKAWDDIKINLEKWGVIPIEQ